MICFGHCLTFERANAAHCSAAKPAAGDGVYSESLGALVFVAATGAALVSFSLPLASTLLRVSPAKHSILYFKKTWWTEGLMVVRCHG